MSDVAAQLGGHKYDSSRPISFGPVSVGVWKGAGLTAAATSFEFSFEAAFSSLVITTASRNLADVSKPHRIDVGGHFLANVPDQDYRGRIIAPMSCVTLFLSKSLLESALDVRYTPSMAIENLSQIRRPSFMPPLMQALFEDARNGHPAGPLLGESIVAAVAHLLHPVEAGKMEIRDRRSARIPLRKLNAVRDLIHARLAEPLHLEDLADFAGMSTRQFSRSFRGSTGLSPHQFIIRARVEHARKLILSTAHTLDEIAWFSGFAGRNHMATSFVKVLGISPSHFRHTHAKSTS
ncbi:AraC-like DNA-binding protein [Bradyrhizobium sp. CIR48]|uniref:helix-turn-helix domain-containing protein n=1 Tax=Bradyrhizobium sp. CIR48 TaxID=2663840 RepID=UPI001606C655|nr:AraC family transcriptional regulator [Bradyrhizobium sp. CIR48]MBB4425420.1 AraC-like DNA-binding protein [Bradyrhizobium sp. CIR48]